MIGRPLVAKQSHVLGEDSVADKAAQKKFVRRFCSTQQLARRLAHEFNEKMESISRIDPFAPRVT
eukprot:CAMPEP_0116831344 /NCGR_PEP_ID=MMETSP0418-20121206/5284_1 /TAXON_ID=1158023 /ORGANISM="Astrosyne radiata, Strain 13vi08-1A" /LENGTH=64 /DNA_ID=CAMNT_0004460583 /DNA_START=404 /DNA_END=594 /DNA_ORIENTATION=+